MLAHGRQRKRIVIERVTLGTWQVDRGATTGIRVPYARCQTSLHFEHAEQVRVLHLAIASGVILIQLGKVDEARRWWDGSVGSLREP